jgi:hypothetical protein
MMKMMMKRMLLLVPTVIVIRQVVVLMMKVGTNVQFELDDAHSQRRRLRKIETLAAAELCEGNGVFATTTMMNSCFQD